MAVTRYPRESDPTRRDNDPSAAIWKTKDKRAIPIEEMTDAHLKNALAWAKRNDFPGRVEMAQRETDRRNLARINAIDPSLRKLALVSWSDADSMQVFVDRLLVEGAIAPASSEASFVKGPDHDPRDGALYDLEVRAREWTLKLFTDPFTLRQTGRWPNVFFTVYRNLGFDDDATLSDQQVPRSPGDRVKFLDVVEQPRLLRALRLT
jgi:hypothetical protein